MEFLSSNVLRPSTVCSGQSSFVVMRVLKPFLVEDVARHNKQEDGWLIIDVRFFSLPSFRPFNPDCLLLLFLKVKNIRIFFVLEY